MVFERLERNSSDNGIQHPKKFRVQSDRFSDLFDSPDVSKVKTGATIVYPVGNLRSDVPRQFLLGFAQSPAQERADQALFFDSLEIQGTFRICEVNLWRMRANIAAFA